jgi:SPP1 gp7 family putative phage head morphogenesis protein
MDSVMAALGDPPNLNNLTPEFWETEAGKMLATIRPELEAMAVAAGAAVTTVPMLWDEVVIAREAAEWARQYAYQLVSGINANTMALLRRVVAAFIETPGMTIGDLRRELAPAFGERRAQMIAVTETTRAFEEGHRAIQRELQRGGLRRLREWRTAQDERVCELCGPLNGATEDQWVDTDGPPRHPRCRCWTVLVKAETA